MLIKKPSDIPFFEITPEDAYFNRRQFLAAAGIVAAGAAVAGSISALPAFGESRRRRQQEEEKPNTWDEITTYNNYYEFGTDKEDSAANAGKFKTRQLTVIDGGTVA